MTIKLKGSSGGFSFPIPIFVDPATTHKEEAELTYSYFHYSFLSDDNTIVCATQSCKDFSQKFIRDYERQNSADAGTPAVPYGGYWNVNDPKLGDSTKLLLTGQINMKQKLQTGLEMLHQIEREFKLVRTRLEEVEDQPHAFVVEGSKRWRIAPPMINLYIFLLRNLRFHKSGNTYEQTISSITGGDERGKEAALLTIKHIKENRYWKVFDKKDVNNYLPLIPRQTNEYASALGIMGFEVFSTGGKHAGMNLKEVYDRNNINWIWPIVQTENAAVAA